MNNLLEIFNPLQESDLLLQGWSKPRILLIAGSENGGSVTDDVICGINVDVTTANNSGDAIACCLRETFSVILCDVEMRSQEGVKIAENFIHNEIARDTPIIFLDGISDSDHVKFSSYKSAPIDYVSKPVNQHILISKINVFLSLEIQRLAMVRMEKNLNQINLDYKLILESAAIGILGIDDKGKMNFLNSAAQALLQSDACLIGTSVVPLLDGPHAKESHWSNHSVRGGCSKSAESPSGDTLMYRPDASSFAADYTFSAMPPESGFSGGVLVFQDISDRKKIERPLHNGEHKIVDGSQDLSDGALTESGSVERPPLNNDLQTTTDYAHDERSSTGVVANRDDHNTTSDVVCVSEPMEGIARFSAVVAHDFNNILAIILGNLELLDYEDIDNSKVQTRLASIRKAADRACTLTNQLLGVSRRQAKELVVSNANEELGGMNQLILAELPSNVTLTLNLDESLWVTSIDPDSFLEAILNLIVNAREAMPDGGQLTLETANVILDRAYCNQNTDVHSGDYVEVSVTDTGRGIGTDTIPFVFEPFFSTKDESRRTGIGLALVYGFCQRSNGHVRLQSSPDIGTTVRLYLPRVLEHQPAANNLESRDSDLEITPTDH
mgnify:CR=1 FL=1|tara:strand:- start:2766 stop:4601 length:1836 start_codon:yes stop_codon:yes gene_type:complete